MHDARIKEVVRLPGSPSAAHRPETDWLAGLRTYLLVIAGGNLAWEAAHLPLYTIWWTGTASENAFAVFHCTGGDILIALAALSLALFLAGDRHWPSHNYHQVALLTVGFGVAYTIFSEWLNIVIRAAWAYSELMPVVPVIDTGLSPLLQWIVVPLIALYLARRRAIAA